MNLNRVQQRLPTLCLISLHPAFKLNSSDTDGGTQINLRQLTLHDWA
jgi:hypothetical protein